MKDIVKATPILFEGKDGWTTWVLPAPKEGDHFRQTCCDCGLTHKWEFRIDDGKVEFRVKRDTQATLEFRQTRKNDFPLAEAALRA